MYVLEEIPTLLTAPNIELEQMSITEYLELVEDEQFENL